MAGMINDTMKKTSTTNPLMAPNADNEDDVIQRNAAGGADASAGIPEMPGYEVSEINMGDDESVESRVASIASKDSPLNKMARSGAMQTANRRGIINSTMAAGAGEKAVLETALPIASQDAQTSFNTKMSNQQATNQMRSQRLSGNQQAILAGQGAEYESELLDQRTGNESELLDQRAGHDIDMQQLRGEQAEKISQLETRAQLLSQANQSASVVYAQTAGAIGQILSNPDIPAEQKQALVDKQMELLDGSLAFISSTGNVDLTGILGRSGNGSNGGGAGGTDSGTGGGTDAGTDAGTGGNTDNYQGQVNQFLQAANGEPSEQFITNSLDYAANNSIPASTVFSALSPQFPDVSYDQFIEEVRFRGYELGPETGWKLVNPDAINNPDAGGVNVDDVDVPGQEDIDLNMENEFRGGRGRRR